MTDRPSDALSNVCREERLRCYYARGWQKRPCRQFMKRQKRWLRWELASGSVRKGAGDGGADLDPGRRPRGSSVRWGRRPPRRALAPPGDCDRIQWLGLDGREATRVWAGGTVTLAGRWKPVRATCPGGVTQARPRGFTPSPVSPWDPFSSKACYSRVHTGVWGKTS